MQPSPDPSTTPPGPTRDAAIPVRRPKVALDDEIPRHWCGGDAFATHFWNALSSTFPDGEAFFVRSVQRYRDQIDDPDLRRAILGFAGQEGQHSHQHDRHVQMLLRQGYTGIATRNRLMRWMLVHGGRATPRMALASTAAIEHLTAILARRLLNEARFTEPMDPRMAPLWRWHALEEAEHKAVAYDVAAKVAPSYALRVVTQAMNTLGLLFEIFDRTTYMLWKDGLLFRRETWRSARHFLFGKQGFLRGLGPDYWPWYRRDFHPDDIDDGPMIETWRERVEAQVA